MTDRDERIEEYYHNGTRELAEWVVDLEDENNKYRDMLGRIGTEYCIQESYYGFSEKVYEILEELNDD